MAEQQQATPVLTYEPPPAHRRPWVWFSAGALVGVLATALAGLFVGRAFWMGGPTTSVTWTGPPMPATGRFSFPQAPGKLEFADNSVGVPYGKFVFFSAGRDAVALRITCPTGDGAAISYEWLHSTQGGSDFTSPDVARGAGTSVEQGGDGIITAGPFSLIWSQGNTQCGWVYWPSRHPDLVVAHATAERPGEFADVLSRTTWQGQDGATLDTKREPIDVP